MFIFNYLQGWISIDGFGILAACVRHAEGKPLGLVRSPSPTLLPLPRGWAGRSTVSP
ncbi:MAG: hypothetical protein NZ519_11755 [Bacteroidia bacterium]|nr:hypothetical protein [Bacteroidia bacterium]